MTKVVVKRDGREVPFNWQKIANAVEAAMLRTEKGVDTILAVYIAQKISSIEKDKLEVEEIQNMVEELLMGSDRKDVAKEYILYRSERTKIRSRNSAFMKTVGDKLTAHAVENQNANVDERSFGGRKGEAANELMRQYALNNLICKKSRDNHLNNEIYIHDLDSYAVGCHNCLTVPLDDLLKNGFNTRQTDVRPANSINTAFQLVAVIFQLQSLQQFGGVSASHLDWTMVPYVRKSFRKHYQDGLKYINNLTDEEIHRETDLSPSYKPEDIPIMDEVAYSYPGSAEYAMDMTKRELQQAVEGMYHNLKV